MKNLLTKTLFISLLLSAAISSGVQADRSHVKIDSTGVEKTEEDGRNNNKWVRYGIYGIGIASAATVLYAVLAEEGYLPEFSAIKEAVQEIAAAVYKKVVVQKTLIAAAVPIQKTLKAVAVVAIPEPKIVARGPVVYVAGDFVAGDFVAGDFGPVVNEVTSTAVVAITSAADKEEAITVTREVTEAAYEASAPLANFWSTVPEAEAVDLGYYFKN